MYFEVFSIMAKKVKGGNVPPWFLYAYVQEKDEGGYLQVTIPVPPRLDSWKRCRAAGLPSLENTDTSTLQWGWCYPVCLPPHMSQSDSGCRRHMTLSRLSRGCSPSWQKKVWDLCQVSLYFFTLQSFKHTEAEGGRGHTAWFLCTRH